MNDSQFDAIVVGAGVSGLACAGELVLRGKRPLLICETDEVAQTMHSVWVDGNRGLMHHPAVQLGWGGGWWLHLARALSIDVTIHHWGAGLDATVRGSGIVNHLPSACVSAASLVDMFQQFSPLPLDDMREQLEKVFHAALAIPHEDLVRMDRIPFAVWLEQHGADEMVSMLMLTFCGMMTLLTAEEATEHLSTFGALGTLRSLICGEMLLSIIQPDAREGLCIPLAKEIERRGGTVWRGRRAARVLIDDGRVTGVALKDGTEVRAPAVALACGNNRIRALLDPLPPEIVEPLSYRAGAERREFCIFAVLDQPVVPPRGGSYLGILNSDFTFLQWDWPLHEIAPWTVKGGQQFLVSERFLTAATIADFGGEDAVHTAMIELNEELYPGYKNAIVDIVKDTHHHHWLSPLHVGPKLPRSIDSVQGLWFVTDSSAPVGGVYSEAAASTGILGARAMVGSTCTQPQATD